jgi:hypothetical protein
MRTILIAVVCSIVFIYANVSPKLLYWLLSAGCTGRNADRPASVLRDSGTFISSRLFLVLQFEYFVRVVSI